MYYLNKGGIITYLLLIISILGVTTVSYKIIILNNFLKKIKDKAKNIIKNIDYNKKNIIDKQIKDEINKNIILLEKGLTFIKIIANTAPVLGLLGTVIGILDSFEKIASQGMNSSFFASGISIALITTVAGLIVAIPHIISYNYLIRKLDKIEIELNIEINKIYPQE